MRARLLVPSLLALGLAAWWLGARETHAPRGPHGRAYAPDGSPLDAPAPTGRAFNVLLVVIDTLRADMLTPEAGRPVAMPLLARRAERGVRFTQALSCSPWTLPSITSLLTSRLPTRHGIVGAEGQATGRADVPTAAQILGRCLGLRAHAWTGHGWSKAPGSMLEGFQEVRMWSGLQGAPDHIGDFAAAPGAERPWLLLWHTFEAHDPYGAANHPHPYRSLLPVDGSDPVAEVRASGDVAELARRGLTDGVFRAALFRDPRNASLLAPFLRYLWDGLARAPREGLVEELRRAYEDGVRWVDGLLERALALMEETGLLRDTLVIVTGDHGEAFGEHGMLQHGRQLYDELLRVPLVMLGPPPFDRGRVIDTPVSLLDLLPTLLALRGLPPPDGADGRSLLPLLAEPPPADAAQHLCLAEEIRPPQRTDGVTRARLASVRDGRWSWILTEEQAVADGAATLREEVFDLARDPAQQTNLAGPAAGVPGFPPTPGFASAMAAARERLGLAPDADAGR